MLPEKEVFHIPHIVFSISLECMVVCQVFITDIITDYL